MYAPVSRALYGGLDRFYSGSAGWCWEEALWAAKHAKGVTFDIQGHGSVDPSDVLVLSFETLALAVLSSVPISDRHKRVLVRTVAQPSDGNDVWDRIGQVAHQVFSWCCIGAPEAAALRAWLLRRGLPARVSVASIGAEVVPAPDFSPRGREGIVYLGGTFPGKRVEVVVEAASRAGISLYMGLVDMPPGTPSNWPDIQKQINASRSLVSIGRYGIIERTQLLSRVRAVVTAGEVDSWWIPGTEGPANGAVSIAGRTCAGKENLICTRNGDDLKYHDGSVEGLVSTLKEWVLADTRWEQEARRQHAIVRDGPKNAAAVGKALWNWVEGAL